MSITFTPESAGPNVNMANGNAAEVLDLLGYPTDEPEGEATAEDFLGRVLLALALLDVSTDDEHGRPTVHDGRWVEVGRRPGYLAERLHQLHEIATAAQGGTVAWF